MQEWPVDNSASLLMVSTVVIVALSLYSQILTLDLIKQSLLKIDIVIPCLYFPPDVVPFTHAYFGEGTSNISLGGVACTGSEGRLVDCVHTQPVCTHAEDAGIRCGGKRVCFTHLSIEYLAFICL